MQTRLFATAPPAMRGRKIKMFNTIRITFDRTQKTATVAVFSDFNDADYLAKARAKVAEVGNRLEKIEVEEWYNERKMKSSKVVESI